MISFLVPCMFILIKYQTADGLVDPAPVVFGEIGQNVTIYSRVEQFSTSVTHISWYLHRPCGKVEQKAYFSSYSLEFDRYIGQFPKGSGNVSLTISSAAITDSGRYFPVMRAGGNFTPGSPSGLVVTDSREDPAMRVFLSRTGVYFCELRGGGARWSDPEWETADGGKAPAMLETEADSYIDDHGVLTRSSTLSISVKEGIGVVKCVSHRDTDNFIQKALADMQHGNGACQWLLYLSPLCVMLLLLTVTGAGFWTRRVMKQTHPAQMRNENQQL
ncbi:hypothetical protein MATL_G00128680 [Megalops atlanticus]|uniref:Immunoglobulin V-set domain-containing protein n=1 Tax=Megalops atlanticus TaxID=7932 RepID=A0A9D3PW04_MEGAT|nr:hypothetical protein MATL_G00128680 [Megalops atlanticus]